MPVSDYESLTDRIARIRPVVFWLLVGAFAAFTIALAWFIVFAGLGEYGGTFIVLNLLVWVTPCLVTIFAACRTRVRSRRR